jgi:flavin reductase (DIM6/NTAB) family NADH-FMN oxidoreductase RutF
MTISMTAPGEAHVTTDPAILYLGTPVVLLSTTNPDGSANLAPISSAFWLGRTATIGISASSRSGRNIARTGEVVLALPSVDQVDAVDRLALTTGLTEVPAHRYAVGYRTVVDKYARAGLTPVPSDLIAPPRPAETPIAMECVAPSPGSGAGSLDLEVRRVHAHPSVLVDGRPNRIDPDRWRPLIMSFQQFYGLGARTSPSRLATIDEEHYRR